MNRKKYRKKAPKEGQTRKFNTLVHQACTLYPYKNQKTKRWIYVISELTRPSPDQWKEIEPLLEEMTNQGATLGIDSTPEEKYNYQLYCRSRLLRIKTINPLYYSTIVVQFDELK